MHSLSSNACCRISFGGVQADGPRVNLGIHSSVPRVLCYRKTVVLWLIDFCMSYLAILLRIKHRIIVATTGTARFTDRTEVSEMHGSARPYLAVVGAASRCLVDRPRPHQERLEISS
jgi:hypothetical protein